MLPLYSLTALIGSALLFVVQPMIGKVLLPLVGGAPGVWAVCMVFFQGCLLVGYGWAYLLGRFVPPRMQPLVHGMLMGASLMSLPIHAPRGAPPAGQAFPALWLLIELTSSIGLPFCAVASTAPLVQRWFSHTRHGRRSDPYFLYAASNAGSLISLLAYPIFIEPWLPLRGQLSTWSSGVWVLFVLELGCAGLMLSMPGPGSTPIARLEPTTGSSKFRPWLWLGLAFVPSSMMLGVTTFVTSDVAAVPLLWVAPLAIYLLTYILAFLRRPPIAHYRALAWLPWSVLALGLAALMELTHPFWLALPVHFGALFVVGLAFHGELARMRPSPHRLTAYYFLLSAGGALGGAFNGLLAPWLFRSTVEYPLVVVGACLLAMTFPRKEVIEGDPVELAALRAEMGMEVPSRGHLARAWRQARVALVVGTAAAVGLTLTRNLQGMWKLLIMGQLGMAACVVVYSQRAHPLRFALGTASLLLAPVLACRSGHTLYSSRSFFGLHRVEHDPTNHRNLYIQGTTIHGLQSTEASLRRVAGAYYHRTGPVGDVAGRVRARHVGLVGLGVGSQASYAQQGQSYTFFEVDPEVVRIAQDARLFSFVSDARDRGATVKVVVGDARQRLETAIDGAFDLLILDAYSSDVVPTHLLTREAFELYLRKLGVHGLILMNLSNRYLELGAVVSSVALDARLVGRERLDTMVGEAEQELGKREGKAVSRWVVLARFEADIASIGLGPEWSALTSRRVSVWTDDYVNVVGSLRW